MEGIMARKFQVSFDCADSNRLMSFWADALAYKPMDLPAGFDSWLAYWRSLGVPEEELEEAGAVHLVDPDGVGPRIYFQEVPEPKVVKNRVHLDLDVSGGRGVPLATRKELVDAEAERLTAAGATTLRILTEGIDYYAVVMQDPEGNEFCLS
jgi:hypothetical protein